MGRLGGYWLPHPEPRDRGRGVHDQRGTVRRIDEYGGDDRGDLCDYRTDSDDRAALHHGGRPDFGVFWRDPAHNAGVAGVHDRTGGSGSTVGGGDINSVQNVLPNVEKAIINPNKLTEYALNPEHPVGGNKAKVFESALGYNQSNVRVV